MCVCVCVCVCVCLCVCMCVCMCLCVCVCVLCLCVSVYVCVVCNRQPTLTYFASPTATPTLHVQSADEDSLWASRYFVPVYCFVFFNLGDTVGRSMSLWFHWPGKEHYKKLLAPVMIRLVFIVLFVFCNVELSSTVRV